MKRMGIITAVAVAVLVAAGAVAYTKVPVVRYFLMPITGSTAAPQSLLGGSDDQNTADMQNKYGMPQQIFSNRTHTVDSIDQVPAEGGWINSKPLDLKKLEKEGKVILIDFWTYTCINCIRANPFDEVYWQRYKNHGLVIIGVASPEFQIEGVPKNVLIGVNREGLTYPILMDADMKVWDNFGNHFWPGKYLINPKGQIVYHKFGEGDYEHEEQVIRQQLIKAGHTNLPPDRPLDPMLDLIPASDRNQTPELYAGPGFLRRPLGNDQQPEAGKTTDFHMPAQLGQDRIYLGGQWKGSTDYAQSIGAGSIGLNYIAQAPYVVLDTAGGAKKIEVTLDGKPVPPAFRGRDMTVSDGKTFITVNEPRLYWPIANRAPYGRHTIRFMVPAGVRLYSFTFGTYEPATNGG
ncbi:MAG: redoxin domain-containing protein [Gammaproteobacteria bacterium]